MDRVESEKISKGEESNMIHRIKHVKFVDDKLFINIDGSDYSFPLSNISKKLLKSLEIERNIFSISRSGYGINWPLIDEDLSINGMLKINKPKATLKKRVSI